MEHPSSSGDVFVECDNSTAEETNQARKTALSLELVRVRNSSPRSSCNLTKISRNVMPGHQNTTRGGIKT